MSTTVAAQGTAPQAGSNPLIWRDDFNGALQSGWNWANENSEEWSLENNPGYLTVWTSPFPTGGQNLLLRSAPAGNFTIETHMLFQPIENFEFAGLVVWQDEGNFLQFGRAFCDPEFPVCVGNGIYFDFVRDGSGFGDNFATPVENPEEAYLRLIRQGSSLKAYYSGNGFDWVMIGRHILPKGFTIKAVGLTSSQHYSEGDAIPADFDYFVLNQVTFPFIGNWETIDIDGGDIRLAIGGKPTGPFRITWTESYFGFCGGEAGIARGNGWINADDPYLLEADLHLTCFTTGDQVDFHPVWRYDPSTGWLTSRDDGFGGFVTTWHRPGESLPLLWNQIIAHPDENWVEGMGFPEGTVVSLLIRDSNGVNLFIGTTVASYPDWDPYNTAARFFLDFDLKAGDHLWMSDGMVARDLIVTNLQITATDFTTKTVSGIATPGREVIIEYFPEESDPVMFSVFADQNGFWTVYVEEMAINLPGLASEPDADGDLTRVTFIVPKMDLRVNYGHDWVESFYEAGHQVEVTVTESDGETVKATATLWTESKDFWNGETGFQTQWSDWSPTQPDIQPNDWVYAQVDNGATAQVQIGDISGAIDLVNDSIEGTVNAPWFYNEDDPIEVGVECHPWGAGGPMDMKYDSVLPDGADTYSCSWAGQWDIQPGQDVGVGYSGPDGHWVANAFRVPQLVLYIHYEYPDVVEGSYELGHTVQVTVLDSEGATKATALVSTMEMPHWGGAPGFRVEEWDGIEGPPDIQPGDVVRAVVDDDLLTTEARIGEIAATIDLDANSITGTINAPWAGDLVNVLCMPWGAPEGTSEKETTVTPNGISEFTCTWDSEWDIQPGEVVGVAYWGDDLHWIANVIPNPQVWAFPEANQVFGYGWPTGSDVSLTINGDPIVTVKVEGAPWDENDIMAFFNFGEEHDLVAGDVVTLSGSGMDREHTVQNLAVTAVNEVPDTVSGTADIDAVVHAWVHGLGHDVWWTVTDGTWTAYFGSDEFYLEPGMCGRAEIRVEGHNSTNVDWCVP